MKKGDPRYYLIKAEALPEVFVKVLEAKTLLETGAARTIAEAVERVDLSRSAFYKYKDAIAPFRDRTRDTIMTFHIRLHDRPGTLASVLSVFTEARANVMTINQSIPANGVALVTVSVVADSISLDPAELLPRIDMVGGVISSEIMAG